jgi:hypothetical protein
LVFCLPIVLVVIAVLGSYSTSGEFLWIKAISQYAIFTSMIAFITIPGFLLHYRYWRHDKGKDLQQEWTYYEVHSAGQISKVNYCEIQKVELHTLCWGRALPWVNYGYVKVILQNGEVMKFTSLLTDISMSAALFERAGVEVDYVDSFYTWV